MTAVRPYFDALGEFANPLIGRGGAGKELRVIAATLTADRPPKPPAAPKIPRRSTAIVKIAGVSVQNDAFLQTREWRVARYRALQRHGGACQCCGSRIGPLHVDHIKPRHTHPELALSDDNLQVLCADCNIGKGAWDDTDWRNVVPLRSNSVR